MNQKDIISKIEQMTDEQLYKVFEALLKDSPKFVEYVKKELGDE